MRISVDAQALSKVLARAAKFVATGATALPVLQAFKLAVKGTLLEASATNLTADATGRLSGEDTEDGAVLVSAKLLAALAKSLSGKIHLQVDGDSLKLRAGKAKYSLAVVANPDQFPQAAEPREDASHIEVDGEELESALAAVTFAASKDEMRPMLQGVRFQKAEKRGTLHLIATNGVRVAQAFLPAAGIPKEFGLTVPAAALRRLPLGGGPITLLLGETSLYVHADGWEYRVSLLEGEYPQVLRLLPSEGSAGAVAKVSRQGLRQAVSRVELLGGSYLRLAIQPGVAEAAITSNEPAVGNAQEVLDAKLSWPAEAEGLQVALNPAFLVEALDALEDDEAELRIVGDRNPVTLIGRSRRHDILPLMV